MIPVMPMAQLVVSSPVQEALYVTTLAKADLPLQCRPTMLLMQMRSELRMKILNKEVSQLTLLLLRSPRLQQGIQLLALTTMPGT